jgi:hypothetical protein
MLCLHELAPTDKQDCRRLYVQDPWQVEVSPRDGKPTSLRWEAADVRVSL